jgi:predicted O-methyltransferase YrrM
MDGPTLISAFSDRGDMRAYANNYLPESEIIQRARQRGVEIGAYDTAPAVGSLLRYLTHLIGATSIVEVGTGSGVSGLWMIPAMSEKSLFTSIDDEVENARLAKQAFDEAGISPARYRLITGNSSEIVGKLADNLYDMFILRSGRDLYENVENAHRSLRPGGIMVIDRALVGGKVADPTQRDEETISFRDSIKLIREERKNWLPMLLPVGEGVLVVTKLADPE